MFLSKDICSSYIHITIISFFVSRTCKISIISMKIIGKFLIGEGEVFDKNLDVHSMYQGGGFLQSGCLWTGDGEGGGGGSKNGLFLVDVING